MYTLLLLSVAAEKLKYETVETDFPAFLHGRVSIGSGGVMESNF